MFARLSSFTTWVRRNLTLSNSPRAWHARLGLLALAGAVVFLWYRGERLSEPLQVALWSVLALAAAVLSRRGWFTLFGPVLFHELVRIARRRRYFLVRGLYAFTLALIFLWVWFLWSISPEASRELSPREMAAMAETFFTTFIVTQFAIVTLLVPAMAGGAIAEEKERKTLEFLLATDLRNREIVLSKLAARVGNVVMLVLAGLPILALIQFFGGIDPDLLLTSFAGLGVTILSLTSLAILFSVLLRRARDAILLTYLTIATYLTLGAFGIYLTATGTGVTIPVTFGSNPITLGDLLDWFNAGNLFSVAMKAIMALMGNQSLSTVLPELFTEYLIFHFGIALFCIGMAVLRLRAVALRQTTEKTRAVKDKLPLHLRPRVRSRPMMWKELRVEGRLRFGWFGTVVLGLLVVASLVPVAISLASLVRGALDSSSPWDAFFGPGAIRGWGTYSWLREELNNWLRFLGAAVASLMLIGVSVRAAGSVSGERARQTLDSLLTTPLEPFAILGAKWLGAILSVRRGGLWLGTFWVVGLATQSLEVLSVLLTVLAWFIYAAGCAALGLWFSLVCKTTLRATVWTLVTVVFLGGGHWIVSGLFVFLPMEVMDLATHQTQDLLIALQLGQTVPVALGVFSFHIEDFAHPGEFLQVFSSALVSLLLWGFATVVLGQFLLVKFREQSGCLPLKHHASSHRHNLAEPIGSG